MRSTMKIAVMPDSEDLNSGRINSVHVSGKMGKIMLKAVKCDIKKEVD